MVFGSLRSSGKPTIQRPLKETNAACQPRDIWWKARPLDNVVARAFDIFSKADNSLTNKHWGVQIGPYLYEVGKDIGGNGHLINNRLKAGQPEFWESTVPEISIGTTTFMDWEINSIALINHDKMRSPKSSKRKQGIYSYNKNNCQRFVTDFTVNLLAHPESDGELPDQWDGGKIRTREIYEEESYEATSPSVSILRLAVGLLIMGASIKELVIGRRQVG